MSFCKSFHVTLTCSPSLIYYLSLKPSRDEKGKTNFSQKPEALNIHWTGWTLMCPVTIRLKGNLGPPNSAASQGKKGRKTGERPSVPRGSRETAQSGGNSDIQKTWSWIKRMNKLSGQTEGTGTASQAAKSKEPWHPRKREGAQRAECVGVEGGCLACFWTVCFLICLWFSLPVYSQHSEMCVESEHPETQCNGEIVRALALSWVLYMY